MFGRIDSRVKEMLAVAAKETTTPEERKRIEMTVLMIALALALIGLPAVLLLFYIVMHLLFS